jgi:hypothetical protein
MQKNIMVVKKNKLLYSFDIIMLRQRQRTATTMTVPRPLINYALSVPEVKQKFAERSEREFYPKIIEGGDPGGDGSPDWDDDDAKTPTEDISCVARSIIANVKVVSSHQVTANTKKGPMKFYWAKVSPNPVKIIQNGPFHSKTKHILLSELGYVEGRKTPYVVLTSKSKPKKGSHLFLVKCDGGPEYDFITWLRKVDVEKSFHGKLALKEYAVITGKKMGVKVPRKKTLARDILTRRVMRARELVREILEECNGHPITYKCKKMLQSVCQGALLDQFNRHEINEVAHRFGIHDPASKTKAELCNQLLMSRPQRGYSIRKSPKAHKSPKPCKRCGKGRLHRSGSHNHMHS